MTAIVDTLSGSLNQAGSLAGRLGRFLWRVLSLSLVDEHFAYQKTLSVALETERASLALGSRLLSRLTLQDRRWLPQDETGLPSPELLASSVAVYLTEKKAPRTGIVLSLPKSWVIIKSVVLPATVRENLTEVVAYEMDRLTPFSAEEVYFDFQVLAENPHSLELALFAARADRIDPYLTAFREKGLRVIGLTTHLVGWEALCRYSGRGPETVFMEVRDADYEGGLFQKGTVAASLTGNFDQTTTRDKADRLAAEVDLLSGEACRSASPPPVLFHLSDGDKSLKEALKLRLSRPVDFVDETAWRLNTGKAAEFPFAAAGALWSFLGTPTRHLNLMTRGKRTPSRTPFWLTLPLLAGLGVLVAVYWITPVQRETQRLTLINQQIIQKKTEIKKVESLKKEIEALSHERNIIHDFKNSRRMTIALLKELTVVIPKDCWLTRTRISETQINIEGYAPSATLLVPKLESSPFFKKVEFASPTYRDPKLNQDRFQIKMEQE